MRASIYNAMPEEGVQKLVSFMKVGIDHGLAHADRTPCVTLTPAPWMQDFAASNQ